MYKVMICKTRNPSDGIYEYECPDDFIAKCFWRNFFTKQIDNVSAGISVYALDNEGNIGEMLANWQADGKNCFCKDAIV